jgi:hypothetical protein
VKYFDWDELKNIRLQAEREVCFEDVIVAINEGYLLDVVTHPNSTKYPKQQIYIVQIREYVFIIPFVEDDEKIFLKTIIPSRRATRKYLKGEQL